MQNLRIRTGKAMLYQPATNQITPSVYPVPTPGDGEILVRVTCCTLCGSDLHTYTGRRKENNEPSLLGHEIIGVIEAIGGNEVRNDYDGAPLRLGQRITWSMVVSCGNCFFCKRGISQKCEMKYKYGHDSWSGVPTGGLAEHCLLRANTPIFSIPDGLSDEVVAPVNCATATVFAASRLVEETHRIQGSKVLIWGAGMLGLTAIARVRDSGGVPYVVEPDQNRWGIARCFGAEGCVDPTDRTGMLEMSTAITRGRGFDISFDFSGVTDAIQQSISIIRIGGCINLVGSVFPTENISLDPEDMVRRMLTIRGLHNYRPDDLACAIKFLERTSSQYPFESLVSETFCLEDTEKAFQFALEHQPIRVAVKGEV